MCGTGHTPEGGSLEELTAVYVGFARLVVLGFFVNAVAVCFQKAKQTLGLLGIVGLALTLPGLFLEAGEWPNGAMALGVVGISCAAAGAIRLAKPDSKWARNRYGLTSLSFSQRRFPGLVEKETWIIKEQLAAELEGWTERPPHMRQFEDALGDCLDVPGLWTVKEFPNEAIYRRPLVSHRFLFFILIVLLPIWPLVLAFWTYVTFFGRERHYLITYAETGGVTEERLGTAERSRPLGLTRTAWTEAPEGIQPAPT